MMAITLTGDSVTLDESFGLQTGGIPNGAEDNDDNDVAFATLQSTFAARLFGAGGLGLDDTFSQDNGVAVANLITLSGQTTITGFLDGSDNPLPNFIAGTTDPTDGVLTSFTTLDGKAIYLFADDDAGLGDLVALGVNADGDIVFAAYLDADADSVDVWLVQFEPISNPDANDPDDPVDLTGLLNVGATTPLLFDFDTLPSGQNLFGIVGESATDPAIIVIGRDIVLNPADNTFTNASNTINTSKGGGPTTIGVNNQMFDPGDGAYFTYVNDPVANFLSGVPGGLTQGEADDADNIQYTGGTLADVTSAFFVISQIQGNALATASVTTFVSSGEQGVDFVNDLGQGSSPDITRVKVYDENGNLIEDTGDLGNFNDPTVNVVGIGTVTATIAGLDSGYKVEFETGAPHDQALIEGVKGKFDIGAFGINQGEPSSVQVGDKMIFEDDGPAIGPILDGQVDFTSGVSDTHLLGAATGTDGASIEITGFTPTVTYDFGTLIGEKSLDGQSVIYFQDVGGTPGVFDDGIDVKFFTLSIDGTNADAANWDYTFEVHQTAPPASLLFTFDELPSGSNLFGVVGESPTDPAIIVIGRDPDLNPDGSYTNQSDVIHTSQGGTGATIGVNNQMFDPGDGAYFTYVDDPEASFLSGVPGGLSQTEADNANNIQYNGGTHEASSAFFVISQIQGNQLATASITTYDLALEEEGVNFVNNLGTGSSPNIIQVKVYDENGDLIEDTSNLGNFDDPNVVVTGLLGQTVKVAGLDSGYKVEYFTDAPHDQSLIEGVKGKFDIGAFGISEPNPTPDKELEFTVAITDFDDDTTNDTFVVGIDGDHDGNVIVV
jgi:hypothetical protein